MKWKPYLSILRPLNCVMTGIGILIGSIVAGGMEVFEPGNGLSVLLAMGVGFLAAGGGNTLNDFVDFEGDKINHPGRPLPSGDIQREAARSYAGMLFLSAFLLSFLVSHFCILIAGLNIGLMILYELRLKQKGFVGNLTISWLTGSVFLFGGAALYTGSVPRALDSPEILATLVLSLLAFLSSAGREIIKDIEDLVGDKDRMTLPMKIGRKRAAMLGALFIIIAVLLSPLPYYPFELFSWLYLLFVIPADALFFLAIASIQKNPSRSQKIAKVAMFVALLSFFVGGVVG